jgi:hypothetical protein
MTINFKKFLKEKGVNTKLFWKNCKKKHQGWGAFDMIEPRKNLKEQESRLWVGNAFYFKNNIIGLSTNEMYELDTEWIKLISKNPQAKVKFGF